MRDRNRTDAFGYLPTLSMSYIPCLHSAEHDTGHRYAPVGTTARTQGLAKDRADKANAVRWQVCFDIFFESANRCVFTVTANYARRNTASHRDLG